jgi:hypothetical protein
VTLVEGVSSIFRGTAPDVSHHNGELQLNRPTEIESAMDYQSLFSLSGLPLQYNLEMKQMRQIPEMYI